MTLLQYYNSNKAMADIPIQNPAQQSAYLYSSSHLFNAQRIQARKAYAQKQQERIQAFDNQMSLHESKQMSNGPAENAPRNSRNGRNFSQQSLDSENQQYKISDLILKQAGQVDKLIGQLTNLKRILTDFQQAKEKKEQSDLTKYDLQFLQLLYNQRTGNQEPIQETNKLEKIAQKISLCNKLKKKQKADASIVYDGKQEIEDNLAQRKQSEEINQQKMVKDQNIFDFMCQAKYQRETFGNIENEEFPISPADLQQILQSQVSYQIDQLENYRKSRLSQSKNLCSIGVECPSQALRPRNSNREYPSLINSVRIQCISQNKNSSRQNSHKVQEYFSPPQNFSQKNAKIRPFQQKTTADNKKVNKTYSNHRYAKIEQDYIPVTHNRNNDSLTYSQNQSEKNYTRQQMSKVREGKAGYLNRKVKQFMIDSSDAIKNRKKQMQNSEKIRKMTRQKKQKQVLEVVQIRPRSIIVMINEIQCEIGYQMIRKIKLMKKTVEINAYNLGNLEMKFESIKEYRKFCEQIKNYQ